MGGAWFGLFIGLVLTFFVAFGEVLAVIASYIVIGAVFGAIWLGVAHWSTRGTRDFSAESALEAEFYDVMVAPELRDRAEEIIGA